jgi:hypothetical protein
LAVTLTGSGSRGYIENTLTREQDFLNCPRSSEIKSPVLAINIPTGPALYYECDLTGFNFFTVSKAQVDAAARESSKYQFAYYENPENLIELRNFVESNNGEILGEIEPHWVRLRWNKKTNSF